jgi:hypothetical protein
MGFGARHVWATHRIKPVMIESTSGSRLRGGVGAWVRQGVPASPCPPAPPAGNRNGCGYACWPSPDAPCAPAAAASSTSTRITVRACGMAVSGQLPDIVTQRSRGGGQSTGSRNSPG